MKRLLILFLLMLTAGTVVFGQTLHQTVRGRVLDSESRQPLAGATVTVRDEAVLDGAITDAEGFFRMEEVPVGRHTIQVSYTGYETAVLREIMATSGKELVLNIDLTESLGSMETELDDVVITGEQNPEKAQNEMATLSSRTFSVEETKRYASSFSDPARMAQNFAGVTSSGFDMENEIVIRGNSPRYMLWRLEGVEIPNPNHFGNMGSSGGPISMLSSSTLGQSDFYTGAFPAEFGNALSGVFDLRFRRGNDEQREYSIMLGVLGLEASTEGYFSKKSRASYLFNYRYSTLALMQHFLPTLEGVLPAYQDASFNVFLPTGKLGDFTLFGLGGDNVARQDAVADSSEWQSQWDATLFESRQRMGVAGVKHNLLLGERTFIRTTLAASADNYEDESYRLLPEENYRRDAYDLTTFRNYSLRLHTMVNHKFDARHTLRYGVLASHLTFDYRYDQKDFWDRNEWTTYLDNDGSTQLLQAYAQWKFRLHEDWTLNAGLHGSYLTLNGTSAIDPRLALSWQAARKHRVSISAGMHSKPEHVSTLFVERTQPDGERLLPNKNLEFTRAAHLVLGYDWSIAPDLHFKAEVYYQHLYDLPIAHDSGSVEAIVNAGNIWDVLLVEKLENDGLGRNMGLDLTLEKAFSHNYYFLATGSLFDSRYRDQFGDWHSTRYNNNYTLNLVGGKEFKMGRDKKNRLGLNGKFLLMGGNRYTPLDLAASQAQGESVYLTDRAYESRVPDYFRFDLGLSYAINAKKATHTILLDIQNITNRENIYTQFYNDETNVLEYAYQNGLFPVLNYRVEF